jgi:hypothetical protein
MPGGQEILKEWQEFYLLTGTPAAVLVAPRFVAASIGAGLLTPERAGTSRVYMIPVVFHFTSVLFACLVDLVPRLSRIWTACRDERRDWRSRLINRLQVVAGS